MSVSESDIADIRSVLAHLDPKSAASADKPLAISDLYAPPAHSKALSFNNPLIVGNRGAGKSVWSGALAHDSTRLELAKNYRELKLDRMVVVLGFHEHAGKVEGVAPSSATLTSLLSREIEPEAIWTAVLLRAVAPTLRRSLPKSLKDVVEWASEDPERAEQVLRDADQAFGRSNRKFLIVFDALDRLAKNWDQIRPLSQGILQLALNMFGFANMRAKVFLRTDQERDEALFDFTDASKLKAMTVPLSWHSVELYGLLFSALSRDGKSKAAFRRLLREAIGSTADADMDDEDTQRAIFNLIAGEFMGADRRRGRTYTWVIDHLADAFHETTPRSFLIALRKAAQTRIQSKITPIDHLGIREGVQAASTVRVDQLGEDYPWIKTVLDDLEGLEVPCPPDAFVRRWRSQGTVARVNQVARRSSRPGPIGLEGTTGHSAAEEVLLDALKSIGVVEERSGDRINMPDLFRVAAKIKRRGGVRPPTAG
ncbi:hypothetical protein IVA88_23825 [Bradyrhizobium sp. 149]|uniref:hypothetical protein n=1 Tax=Bradyrhizobium sp. 149 TaxID=2782624 RepID=UPI001FFA1784|nr:hypothetical protein [Bradyrhizobium sp. 149]MCK1654450.1 hypothetical protein [Bradyrhizobium sp. 149]